MKITGEKIVCTHCGDSCGRNPVKDRQNLPFCCEGCKMVYELFNENGLCDYYDLEQNPGIKITDSSHEGRFAFLDAQEVHEKLIDFSDGKTTRVTFYIPGIHCSSCIWLLENLKRLDTGVVASTVNFPKKEVSITYREGETTLRKLAELLTTVGYGPQINFGERKQRKMESTEKNLALKIGVAGFAFGNIMLLSIPEYLDTADDMGLGEYGTFFSHLNILLSLPVVLYAGTGYFASAVNGLKSRYLNIDVPIAIGIAALFIRSTYEILSGTGAGYMDSLAGLVFFLLIGKWYQNKTYKALAFDRDYKSYFPMAVNRITGSQEKTVLVEDLRPGDCIRIRNGELIPTDGTLKRGNASLDYSFVTGESEPVPKTAGEKIFAGGRQVGGIIDVEIEKEVSKSYLTELWNQEVFSKGRAGFRSVLDRFSRYFTFGVLIIATLTAACWLFIDPSRAVLNFTAVLIVACPCALALSLPFALGNSMRMMSKNGAYVKDTSAIEKLAKTDTVVFDKTGTITQGKKQSVRFEGANLTGEGKVAIRSLVANSNHPLSRAVYQHLDGQPIEVFDFVEVPGKGIAGEVNRKKIVMGSPGFLDVGQSQKGEHNAQVHVKIGNHYLGFFGIRKEYRPGLRSLLKKLSGRFNLHLLTGDVDKEKQLLGRLFPRSGQLHFNQSPQDKLSYIENLKSEGRQVAMIGDGLNDAGALKAADVGISISDDVYNFSPSCDMILDAKYFSGLHSYFTYSRKSMNIVKASLAISLLYNVVGLLFAVTGLLSPLVAAILMPLSSVTVVGFAVLSTTLAWRN